MIIEKSKILSVARLVYGISDAPKKEKRFVDDVFDSVTNSGDITDLFSALEQYGEDRLFEGDAEHFINDIIWELNDREETARLLYKSVFNWDNYDILKKLWIYNREWLTEEQQSLLLKHAESVYDKELLKSDLLND